MNAQQPLTAYNTPLCCLMSPIWHQCIMEITELSFASAVSMRVIMLQEQRAGAATSAVELRNGED